jgi:hypothetical protein
MMKIKCKIKVRTKYSRISKTIVDSDQTTRELQNAHAMTTRKHKNLQWMTKIKRRILKKRSKMVPSGTEIFNKPREILHYAPMKLSLKLRKISLKML